MPVPEARPRPCRGNERKRDVGPRLPNPKPRKNRGFAPGGLLTCPHVSSPPSSSDRDVFVRPHVRTSREVETRRTAHVTRGEDLPGGTLDPSEVGACVNAHPNGGHVFTRHSTTPPPAFLGKGAASREYTRDQSLDAFRFIVHLCAPLSRTVFNRPIGIHEGCKDMRRQAVAREKP
eukprot:scaffold3066_cov454-Pavlova_lutheri.AAC.3